MTITELLNRVWGCLSQVFVVCTSCLSALVTCFAACSWNLWLEYNIQVLSSHGPPCHSDVISYHSYPSPVHPQCRLLTLPEFTMNPHASVSLLIPFPLPEEPSPLSITENFLNFLQGLAYWVTSFWCLPSPSDSHVFAVWETQCLCLSCLTF